MIQFLPQLPDGCHLYRVCLIQNDMRWAIFSILLFVSQKAFCWYPEYGKEISGVGSYDTTGSQFILIAFNRVDKCGSASLWIDRSLHNHNLSEDSNRIMVRLAVDSFQSWTLPFEILESEYWLPRPWALNQNIPAGLLKQLGTGRMLIISGNQRKYAWDLAGSSLAMKSAYKACAD